MMTPDAMEVLRWTAAVAVGGITAVAICAVYAGSVVALMWLLCRESGQEGANVWQATYEDYEWPQEDSRGA